MVDFTVENVSARLTLFRPQTPRARDWLAGNYSSTEPLRVATENVRMVIRTIRLENFTLPAGLDDEIQLDFADQYSSLLRARSMRIAGNCPEALVMLVQLRADVLIATDTRSEGLLPMIDGEITAARRHTFRPKRRPFKSCRTDNDAHRSAPPVDEQSSRFGGFAGRLNSAIGHYEGLLTRIAISILLSIDIYKFIKSSL